MLPKHRSPTHPGEILLKEFLEPLEMTNVDLARKIGWNPNVVSNIIHGKRHINAMYAFQLAGVFKTTNMEFWLNLQHNWDVWHAIQAYQKDKGKKAPKRRRSRYAC